ncbi:MAG: hypothetical protein PHG16_05525 [Lachnospiraceae bacterium]|nr:hypothetical protein [Lachnospiraceae bacterium]
MKKYRYSFAPDQNAKGGVASAVIAAASLGILLICVGISFFMKGKGGSYIGAVGLFSLLLSAYGFYLGLKSFSEKKVNHKYSIIGSMGSGVLTVIWLGLFLSGI